MGRTLILRPISDISVNHLGKNGNTDDITENRYTFINEVTPDGQTSYIYDNQYYSTANNQSNHNSEVVSTFKISCLDTEENKPTGKIRLNNINYITSYTSFIVTNATINSDTIQCAISIDNNEYSYSTTYSTTTASNSFYTYNHNLNNISSSQLGKKYNSVDDLNINLMVITKLNYR